MSRQRWANIGLALLSVLTVVMVVLALTKQGDVSAGSANASPPSAGGSASESSPPPSQQVTPQPSPSGADADGPVAVFIGDDATAGAGGDGTTWTGIVAQRMGWVEVNLARGGTGYVTSLSGEQARAACGQDTCPAYRDMVDEAAAADPDIILVSGGRNDGEASVTNAAATLYLALDDASPGARIIAVSPLWDDSDVPADLAGTKQGVSVAASRAGVGYLDIGQPLAGRADLIADDGVNPNAEGHRAIAEAVIAELE